MIVFCQHDLCSKNSTTVVNEKKNVFLQSLFCMGESVESPSNGLPNSDSETGEKDIVIGTTRLVSSPTGDSLLLT